MFRGSTSKQRGGRIHSLLFDKLSFILYDKKLLIFEITAYPRRGIMNNEDLRKRIGGRLRKLREEQGLTQKAVAVLMGRKKGKEINYTYLGKIERGEQYPSLKLLKRLADTFSITLGYFFVDGKEAVEMERAKEGSALLGKIERLNSQEKKVVECLIKRLGERKEKRE